MSKHTDRNSAASRLLFPARRYQAGLTGLAFATAVLTASWLSAHTPEPTAFEPSAAGAFVQQDKKKKKQRGKTVKARMVPSEPPPSTAPEESEVTEVAPAPVVEESKPTAAAPAPVEAAPAPAPAPAEAEAAPAQVVKEEAPKPSRSERRAAERAAKEEAKAQASAVRATSSTAEPTATTRAPAAATAASAPAPRASSSATTTTPAVTPSAVTTPAKPVSATATATTAAPARVAADVPRATATTAPPTRPRDVIQDRVVVREVLLDVLVNDKKGNPIVGLGPDDFVVSENGEVREVTSATFYGGEEFSGSGREGNARTDRYFIFMFHDLKQANPQLTGSQIDAGRWATRWLEDGMLPNDQIAVVGYDVRLKLYQDFSRDRNEIAEAILAASRGGKDPDRWKSRSAPVFDPDSPSLFVNLPTGATLSKATPKIQQALELLGNAAEGIAGRKNLVLFSLGFGETRGSFGDYVPDARYYPPMEQSLNNGNVAVYAINTLGARRGGNTMTGITDSLSVIAQDTGGYYYSNHNNVKTPLKQVAKDNAAYYLLSYRTEYDLGTQGYQEVEIETTAAGAKVKARQGYRYGVAPGENP